MTRTIFNVVTIDINGHVDVHRALPSLAAVLDHVTTMEKLIMQFSVTTQSIPLTPQEFEAQAQLQQEEVNNG